ncbi:hypothetical protein OIU84_023945 [Salix udensis]|uniref:Uncharacterized protein n=1 Tax=Salix udensis TaxID=889485 RepID=A0AAD6PBY0_9ROSI|nr:hypothetical protein OIU84_023945 [Salix udensis]
MPCWSNGRELRPLSCPSQSSITSAMILDLVPSPNREKSPFKFLNQWAKHDDFLDIVRSVWNQRIVGNPLYRSYYKAHFALKVQFKKKHHNCTQNISFRVFRAKKAWEESQRVVDNDPLYEANGDAERTLAKDYMFLCKEEEAYFRQKSRIQWLSLGGPKHQVLPSFSHPREGKE